MDPSVVFCPRCRSPLPPELFNQPVLSPCPRCEAPVRVEAFPALLAGWTAGKAGERILLGDEASCFNHPAKKAVVPCDNCGRFLCALCDIEVGSRHLCPACVRSSGAAAAAGASGNSWVAYDSLALALACVPPCGLVSLYLAARYWSARPPAPRTRLRWILAVPLAAGQIALLALLVIWAAYG